jgi:hypothetical protein
MSAASGRDPTLGAGVVEPRNELILKPAKHIGEPVRTHQVADLCELLLVPAPETSSFTTAFRRSVGAIPSNYRLSVA